jgi:hypothetical protein
MGKSGKISLLLVVMIAIVGCHEADPLSSSPGPAGLEATDLEGVEALRQLGYRIEEMTAERNCTADVECRSIALGVKSCGGPWRYLIYSTATTSPTEIEALVEEYNILNARLNDSEGWISDCSMAREPQRLGCIDELCVDATYNP